MREMKRSGKMRRSKRKVWDERDESSARTHS